MAEDGVWSQLVSLTDVSDPEVMINKDRFVIGRDPKACDLSFEGNKLVSGKHCYIERDDDGKIWLYDTSTNGTLLNLKTKITKGECRELQHGDEIYIVFKKDEPDKNIGYMFQDKSILDQGEDSDSEDEETQDYTKEVDQTLADGLINELPSPVSAQATKRSAESDEEKTEGPPEKCQKVEEGSKAKLDVNVPEDNSKKGKEQEPEDSAILESLVCIICQELLHDCISLQPCMHSFCAGCYSEWMELSKECPSCRMEVERINKNHLVNNLVEAFLTSKPGFQRPEEDLNALDAKNKITRDMLYPATKHDHDGPSSDYSDEDEEGAEEEEEEEEEPDDDGNNDYNPPPFNNYLNNAGTGALFGFGRPVFGVTRPANVICRQCPSFNTSPHAPMVTAMLQRLLEPTATTSSDRKQQTADGNSTATATAGPSTSGTGATGTQDAPDPDAKVIPQDPPPFTCQYKQNHILCMCCMQPMPERRREFVVGGKFPPQQCNLCYRAFCHAYWGCLKVDCMGCLARFRDLNFGKKCLISIILDNAYESEVFKTYLEDKGISVKKVLADCLDKVNSGEYTFQNRARFINGVDTPVCYGCGIQVFKELAYQYRKDIPRDQLPAEVSSRPNCYWGKNCRTQKNKPEHAQRFNHICEQTRTT